MFSCGAEPRGNSATASRGSGSWAQTVGAPLHPAQQKLFSGILTAGEVYRALWRHKWFIAALTAACLAGACMRPPTRRRPTKRRPREGAGTRTNGRRCRRGAASVAGPRSRRTREWSVRGRLRRRQGPRRQVRPAEGVVHRPPATPSSVRPPRPVATRADGCRRQECVRARTRNDLEGEAVRRPRPGSRPAVDHGPQRESAERLLAAAAAPEALRSFIRRTGSGSERIIVIKPATTSSAVSRHVALNAVVALMLGLIFNGALALLIELFRDRLPERRRARAGSRPPCSGDDSNPAAPPGAAVTARGLGRPARHNRSTARACRPQALGRPRERRAFA